MKTRLIRFAAFLLCISSLVAGLAIDATRAAAADEVIATWNGFLDPSKPAKTYHRCSLSLSGDSLVYSLNDGSRIDRIKLASLKDVEYFPRDHFIVITGRAGHDVTETDSIGTLRKHGFNMNFFERSDYALATKVLARLKQLAPRARFSSENTRQD
jgi:hypothetical protein